MDVLVQLIIYLVGITVMVLGVLPATYYMDSTKDTFPKIWFKTYGIALVFVIIGGIIMSIRL